MKNIFITVLFSAIIFISCKDKKDEDHTGHDMGETYTCPMPQDSVFSDKPGKCPKCGMDLVKMENDHNAGVELGSLLQPTNEFVLSSVPVNVMQKRKEQTEIEALGTITYDTRQAGMISARVSGRIEKLYIRYRYQKVTKGQRILDLYSPEILTAQQNLLFLLKNDPENSSLIDAAKQRLLLIGMSAAQMQQIIRSGKPSLTVSVYSNYTGHIHEAVNNSQMNASDEGMKDISLITEELSLKEGMYIQKGQSFFSVFNPDKAWAVLNIYGDNQSLVSVGDAVQIFPETNPDKDFRAKIDFIEPFYREGSKTVTARVFFDNRYYSIPIGSRIKATVFSRPAEAWWLPAESVLSLGMDKVVFKKEGDGFRPMIVATGIQHKNHVQIVSGITERDSVAVNAQFLMDSESFIKLKTNK